MSAHRFTLLQWRQWRDGDKAHVGVCCDCGWNQQITPDGWTYPWPTPMDAASAYAEHLRLADPPAVTT